YFWLMISDNPAWVRGESLFFALLSIPLYYFIGKRLNGELTGIFAAALLAFSHASILESSVVRNYTAFLFFLSASFYFYLLLREENSRGRLAAYAIFGLCACLTHFSGIFAFAVIGACEMLRLLCTKAGAQTFMRWIAANAIIALGTL